MEEIVFQAQFPFWNFIEAIQRRRFVDRFRLLDGFLVPLAPERVWLFEASRQWLPEASVINTEIAADESETSARTFQ